MGLLSRTKKLFGGEASTKAGGVAVAKKTPVKKAVELSGMQFGEVDLQILISEKAMKRQAGSIVVFRVPTTATKGQIAAAVATQYGVKALSVRTAHMSGKSRRRAASFGMTNAWKKAYVKVSDIQKINVAP